MWKERSYLLDEIYYYISGARERERKKDRERKEHRETKHSFDIDDILFSYIIPDQNRDHRLKERKNNNNIFQRNKNTTLRRPMDDKKDTTKKSGSGCY